MMFKKPTRLAVVLWACILAGFALMEFPGVLFFHDMAEPRILGLPFIYGFNVVVWAFMCLILFIGYRTRWGRRPVPPEDETDAPDPTAEPTGGAR